MRKSQIVLKWFLNFFGIFFVWYLISHYILLYYINIYWDGLAQIYGLIPSLMDQVRPEEIELRSAQRRWANISPKECWVGIDPNIFFFSFFFWTGPDPAQPFWSGMTLEIWKGGRRGRSGLVVAHEVASGDEEEEC
jgi:hypothetical protein